jgi:hypothetical protein
MANALEADMGNQDVEVSIRGRRCCRELLGEQLGVAAVRHGMDSQAIYADDARFVVDNLDAEALENSEYVLG